MVLLILIKLATLIFYSNTLWSSFKVLKVIKRRRKIQPPILNPTSNIPSNPIQTPTSSHPLTQAQRERRNKIRQHTQLCLVWVIWTRSKRFLDWISWAIPFYDELNLAFLIWLILMGPSAADTVFRHAIDRLVAPHEQLLDSILGTIHDFLLITGYLFTSGPKQLILKWKKWKARQFNKSLLSTRTVAPTTRLHVPPSHHPQLQKLKPEKSSVPVSIRDPTANAVLTQAGSSTYLVVPQRKLLPSRKLSDGYKRSVSNSRPKALLCDTALFNTRSSSTNRTVYPSKYGSASALLPTDLNHSKRSLKSPIYSQNSALRHKSFENMHPSHQALTEHPAKDDQENSIIIHDDSVSLHGTDVMSASSICYPPIKISRQKRLRNLNDDDDVIAFQRAKKALRATCAKRVDKVSISKVGEAHPQVSDVAPAPMDPTTHQDGQSFNLTSSIPHPLPYLSCSGDSQAPPSSWQTSSSAAFPTADLIFLPSKVETSSVQRRPLKPDEPLPPPKSQPLQHQAFTSFNSLPLEHQDIREKALSSVRSLTSTKVFPSPSRSEGWLAHRLPSSITANANTSSTPNQIKKSTRRVLSRSVDTQKSKRKSTYQFIHEEYLKQPNRSKMFISKRKTSAQLEQLKKVNLPAEKN